MRRRFNSSMRDGTFIVIITRGSMVFYLIRVGFFSSILLGLVSCSPSGGSGGSDDDPPAPSSVVLGLDASQAVNQANGNAFVLMGSCPDPGATLQVTLTDGADESRETQAICGANKEWATEEISLESLQEGELAVRIAYTDPQGESQVLTGSILKDTLPPKVRISYTHSLTLDSPASP